MMVVYQNALDSPIPAVTMHGNISRLDNAVKNIETVAIAFAPRQSVTIPFLVGGLAAGTYTLSTSAALTGGQSLTGISVMEFEILPNGSLFEGWVPDFTVVKGPSFAFGGTNPFVQTTYRNNLDVQVYGIAWLVIRNGVGQTVAYSTATIVPTAGGNATAFDVVFGLPPGTYYATAFVTSVSRIALSDSSSLKFTI